MIIQYRPTKSAEYGIDINNLVSSLLYLNNIGGIVMTNIKTISNKSYTEDGYSEIIETYIDDDLFEIIERYYDNDNYLVYEYVHDKTPGELLKTANERELPKKKVQITKQDKLNKKLEKNRKRG